MSLSSAYQNSPAHSRWAAFWLRRERDSAGRGPSLSRCPPGGSLRSDVSQPSGLTALLSVSATRRPRASSRPPYDENEADSKVSWPLFYGMGMGCPGDSVPLRSTPAPPNVSCVPLRGTCIRRAPPPIFVRGWTNPRTPHTQTIKKRADSRLSQLFSH